jgi:DNA polymerase V
MIIDAVTALYDRIVNPDFFVRRLNVTVNNVVGEGMAKSDNAPRQLDLFTDYEKLSKERELQQQKQDKERRIQNAQILIKQRFGKNAILRGLNFEEGATARERNSQIGGHKA